MENWKPIKDFDKYQISDLGRVKNITTGRILANVLTHPGYYTVKIRNEQGPKRLKIHRLIMLAFVPNPENKPTVNHINGVTTDNRLENLEWCTNAENIQHAFRIGLAKGKKGIAHNRAKLTEQDVIDIRTKYAKTSILRLAKIYNVDHSTIWAARKRMTWTHILTPM